MTADIRALLDAMQARADGGRRDLIARPRLVAALRAVLELHRPERIGKGTVCIECGYRRHPCATHTAIATALGADHE